jgi:hypothetical protein
MEHGEEESVVDFNPFLASVSHTDTDDDREYASSTNGIASSIYEEKESGEKDLVRTPKSAKATRGGGSDAEVKPEKKTRTARIDDVRKRERGKGK